MPFQWTSGGALWALIGLFFSIVTLGLAAALPSTLSTGLITNGVPRQAATTIAHLPPTAALFGEFLGYNPIGELISPSVLHAISLAHQAILLGKSFFPNLIATPFMESLHAVFYISAALCLIGAAARCCAASVLSTGKRNTERTKAAHQTL